MLHYPSNNILVININIIIFGPRIFSLTINNTVFKVFKDKFDIDFFNLSHYL